MIRQSGGKYADLSIGQVWPREFGEGRSNTAAVGWCRPARWGCVMDLATQKVGFPTAECRGHCPVGSHDR